MNYETMSDFEINVQVAAAFMPECNYSHTVNELKNGEAEFWCANQIGETVNAGKYDFCNNPADWGKLMHDNKISCSWYIDEEGGNEDCWEAHASARWENAQHPTSPGRAISICYLKMKEANNG